MVAGLLNQNALKNMKQQTNPVIAFFASVKLALFVLFVLASTSIIGTIIPQNEPAAKYVEYYGETAATVFRLLDIDNMYNSWWFLTLLTLLSINLIVCTLKRLPHVWGIVVADNLKTTAERLRKMSPRRTFTFDGTVADAASEAKKLLGTAGHVKERSTNDSTLLFTQKGAWTRLGVYVVHFSILVIFVGAIIGVFYGYKAFVMLPAADSTNVVYETGSRQPIPLGFDLRCDNFSISFYDTGAPKEFRSDLTIEKNGTEIITKSIVVNDPLQYEGLTFYQASYQAMEGQLFVRITNNDTKATLGVPTRIEAEIPWADEGVDFGILNYKGPDRRGQYSFKIWFTDGQGTPSEFWMPLEGTVTIQRPNATYDFFVGQYYATGLQVAKDPGVWWVYIGCALMLLGITVAFFFSHRRIWVFISRENDCTTVIFSGSANKNKLAFDNIFYGLINRVTKHQSFTPQG